MIIQTEKQEEGVSAKSNKKRPERAHDDEYKNPPNQLSSLSNAPDQSPLLPSGS